MLTLVGLAVIVLMTTLLILGRIAPVVGLTIIPLTGALGAGFNIAEIAEFFETGISDVTNVAVMLVFAILFFGIMNDVGLFNPLIRLTVRLTRGNVIAVCVGTVLLATVCHLDGAGASTYLIVLPALLPLYKHLGMSPYLLLLLSGTSMGILNMLPWGGPVGRSAASIGADPVDIWQSLIPVQVLSLVLLVVMAVLLGHREKRRIAARQAIELELIEERELVSTGSQTGAGHGTGARADDVAVSPADDIFGGKMPAESNEGPVWRLWANAALVLATLAFLVTGLVPPGLAFMLALAAALLLNYPKVSDQMARIRAHGGAAVGTGAIILAAGCFLGIMSESGMLEALANDAVGLLPESLLPYVHIIVGVFGIPLELLLSTDAHYFALLPVVDGIAAQAGVSSMAVANSVIVGNVIGTYISPFNASLWLGLGLAGADMGRHIRYSFFPMWAFSVVVLGLSLALGLIPMR
ncbi:CitMHS family transporter [Zhihengliuella halotolerans]|uniref:CitMHS family transporter n=1 Tax=Zhihengliuella halotolerans TaxID=370736 RepID=UPI000C809F13|nr:citrate:proton symporter [Zhihengliuella halotolerans]